MRSTFVLVATRSLLFSDVVYFGRLSFGVAHLCHVSQLLTEAAHILLSCGRGRLHKVDIARDPLGDLVPTSCP